MSSFRLWIYSLITRWIPETRCFGFKCALLRWCGATIGKNVRINSSAVFSGTGGLVIGDDVWIGPGSYISPVGKATITIGSHVDIAPQVMLLTGSHMIDPTGIHIAGDGISAPVKIGEGCWIAARTLVLPGVEIADKTLVAAGSVVIKSTDEVSILLAGVPAKQKRSI